VLASFLHEIDNKTSIQAIPYINAIFSYVLGKSAMDHVRSEYTGDMEVDEYYAAYEYPDATNNSGNKCTEIRNIPKYNITVSFSRHSKAKQS
jgi:hypothetical protein